MSKKENTDCCHNLQEDETVNSSTAREDKRFTKETIIDTENIFTIEGTLTAIIEDLTDLKAESKSTQKSIFLLKRDLLKLQSIVMKKGGHNL